VQKGDYKGRRKSLPNEPFNRIDRRCPTMQAHDASVTVVTGCKKRPVFAPFTAMQRLQ
jgi:hypothetical protein